ncbi:MULTISPECIES: hypothetical protein [Amycolatopsis]|uniref:hypothetical protein n=1 Tax=Amycolatopsis TaxID=1813 RepID=UPI00107021AF|nr:MULTISPECIES: hypothetical protein [Amycolatopsis]
MSAHKLIVFAIAAAVLAISLAGCGSSTGADPAEPASPVSTWKSMFDSSTVNPSAPLPTTESTSVPPAANDFEIALKTVSKHCFGSAGCNVVVEPKFTYKGTSDLDHYTCDITYEITGDKSGPITETATGTTPGKTMVRNTVMTTSSTKTKVAAAVTSAECKAS